MNFKMDFSTKQNAPARVRRPEAKERPTTTSQEAALEEEEAVQLEVAGLEAELGAIDSELVEY